MTLVIESLPDGRRVWISEHGYIEIEPASGAIYEGGRVRNPEWRHAFQDIDDGILVIVHGTICYEDGRDVEYDSPEWISKVREFIQAKTI